MKEDPNWCRNLDTAEVTVAETLRDAGYRTIYIGKWHLAEADNPFRFPTDHGFDINIGGSHYGNPNPFGGFFAGSDGGWDVPGLETQPNGEPYPPDAYLTDVLTDFAELYIEESVELGQPLFLMLAHYDVHTPNTDPDPVLTQYFQDKLDGLDDPMGHTNAVYAAKLKKTDDSLGRILDRLDDPNGDGDTSDSIRDNTIVIFASDNGGYTALTSNRPLREGKGSIHDGGIRTPFIVSWTGNGEVGQGQAIDARTSLEDIYPTILDLADVAGDPNQVAEFDGMSIRPALEGQTFERGYQYWHYPHRSNQDYEPFGSALRAGDWKLLYYYDAQRHELYNLADEIGETSVLLNSRPDIAQELSAALRGYLDAIDAQTPIEKATDENVPLPPIVGCIGYWDFEQFDGGLFPDHGNPPADDAVAVDGAGQSSVAKVGTGAVLFDVDDSLLDLGTGDTTILGDACTITAWIRPENTSGTRHVFSSNASGNCHYSFRLESGVPRFGVRTEDSGWVITPSEGLPPLSAGEWHHIVAIYDGAQLAVYGDGLLYGEALQFGEITHDRLVSPLLPAAIGAESGESGGTFDGLMDEVSLWNVALSEGMAKAFYNVTSVAALSQYTVLHMQTLLYEVYNRRLPTTIDGYLWSYTDNLTGDPGDVIDANDALVIQFGSSDGVRGVADCNDNGVPDVYDIADGTRTDFNGNGIPDECECLGDLDGDGAIGLSDLAQLLANYGTTNGAEYEDGDLDGDGDVDLSDLAGLLSVYGTTCER